MITVIKSNEIISYDLKVTQSFNNYFVHIVPSLKINCNKDFVTDNDNQEDPIQVVLKSKNQSIILVINNKNSKKNDI